MQRRYLSLNHKHIGKNSLIKAVSNSSEISSLSQLLNMDTAFGTVFGKRFYTRDNEVYMVGKSDYIFPSLLQVREVLEVTDGIYDRFRDCTFNSMFIPLNGNNIAVLKQDTEQKAGIIPICRNRNHYLVYIDGPASSSDLACITLPTEASENITGIFSEFYGSLEEPILVIKASFVKSSIKQNKLLTVLVKNHEQSDKWIEVENREFVGNNIIITQATDTLKVFPLHIGKDVYNVILLNDYLFSLEPELSNSVINLSAVDTSQAQFIFTKISDLDKISLQSGNGTLYNFVYNPCLNCYVFAGEEDIQEDDSNKTILDKPETIGSEIDKPETCKSEVSESDTCSLEADDKFLVQGFTDQQGQEDVSAVNNHQDHTGSPEVSNNYSQADISCLEKIDELVSQLTSLLADPKLKQEASDLIKTKLGISADNNKDEYLANIAVKYYLSNMLNEHLVNPITKVVNEIVNK